MHLRLIALATFLLVAVGSVPAQKAAAPLEDYASELKLARLKVAIAQAEVDHLQRAYRQQVYQARRRIDLLEQKRKLASIRLRELENRKELEGKDHKAVDQTTREVETLGLELDDANADLTRLQEAASAAAEAEQAPRATEKKTLPMPALLKQLQKDLALDVDIDFSDIEARDFHTGQILSELIRKYKLTILHPGAVKAPLQPFTGGRMTLGGLIQLIDDNLTEHVLVVRDYGITALPRKGLSPDVLTYREFRREHLPFLPR